MFSACRKNQQSEPTVLGNSSVKVAMQDEGFCYVVVSWGGVGGRGGGGLAKSWVSVMLGFCQGEGTGGFFFLFFFFAVV